MKNFSFYGERARYDLKKKSVLAFM